MHCCLVGLVSNLRNLSLRKSLHRLLRHLYLGAICHSHGCATTIVGVSSWLSLVGFCNITLFDSAFWPAPRGCGFGRLGTKASKCGMPATVWVSSRLVASIICNSRISLLFFCMSVILFSGRECIFNNHSKIELMICINSYSLRLQPTALLSTMF